MQQTKINTSSTTSRSAHSIEERLRSLRDAENKPVCCATIVRNFHALPDPPDDWFPIIGSGGSALVAHKLPISPAWAPNVRASAKTRRANFMRTARKALYYRLARVDFRKLYNGAKTDMKNLAVYEPEWKLTYEEYRHLSRNK